MAVVRIEKTKDYTVMSNYHFREREMSLKAKGLLSFMISLPDDWDYSIAGLETMLKESNGNHIPSCVYETTTYSHINRCDFVLSLLKQGFIDSVELSL